MGSAGASYVRHRNSADARESSSVETTQASTGHTSSCSFYRCVTSQVTKPDNVSTEQGERGLSQAHELGCMLGLLMTCSQSRASKVCDISWEEQLFPCQGSSLFFDLQFLKVCPFRESSVQAVTQLLTRSSCRAPACCNDPKIEVSCPFTSVIRVTHVTTRGCHNMTSPASVSARFHLRQNFLVKAFIE